ncbi:MAG TPA: VOC family protein [Steroidobacteraceae bacterium]|nr:VOC family protein [Steroidobacteraceae bacterium]
MISLDDIRYVRLGTANLDDAVSYATRILGLELVQRDRAAAYLRSDQREHTLVYTIEDARQHSVGFEVRSAADLDAAAARLEQARIRVRAASVAECEQRHVDRAVFFADPTGNNLELVVRPAHGNRRYFPSRDAGITGFSHIGLHSRSPREDEEFWTSLFNARVSDWIGDAPLLRIDPVHHRMALFPSKRSGVQHINHQVESIDDLMRSYYFLKQQNVKILFGPGRHPTSGAVFLYFEGPDGMVYEYSTGVRIITDEEGYRPRQFPAENRSFCAWGAVPEIPEFTATEAHCA